MATSLAAQLQRLAAPQTSILADVRKKPSILFDAKEAAGKDREVIYDIGVSGLEELTQLNGAFAQFEETLFAKNSMDLQRSIENKELNEKLNQNIRKFFYHLSPYFMLQPAHKCLEWLIRRFDIYEYNKADFVNLILPYHETRIFVRCVQTMRFTETESYAFLLGVRKSGVPLSKRTIIDHAVRHPTFLKTISTFTVRAVEELGTKANVLQALFAFYCTTVLGVLDSVDSVTEKYVVSLLQALGKGLTSSAVDYTAASYMIIGQLVTKTSLLKDTLEYIIRKLCQLQHPALTTDATMLLALIFKTQHEQLGNLSDSLIETIVSSKWLTTAMSEVKTDGVCIIVFYRKVLEKCLQQICQTGKSVQVYGRYCEQLLLEILLTDEEAEHIIQCVLDSYFLADSPTKKHSPDDVLDVSTINLDSDDEDFVVKDKQVTQWYSDFLKSFERQYPAPFDKVVKRVMKGQDQFSHKKRNALRNVLGFLLQASYDQGEADLFENLFHYEAERRLNAVKYMVNNLETLKQKTGGRIDLLRDSVLERLGDDSSEVVGTVLQLSGKQLLELIDVEQFVAKLHHITLRCVTDSKRWRPIASRVIELLTDRQLYERVDKNRIVIILYPLLFPLGNEAEDKETSKQLLATKFAKQYLVPKFYSTEQNCDVILNALKEGGQCANAIQVGFNISLVSAALPTPCTVEQADRVLNYAIALLKNSRFQQVPSSDLGCLVRNQLPMDLCIVPIRYIIERVTFESHGIIDLEHQSTALRLQLRILSQLVNLYCKIDPQHQAIRAVIGDLLKSTLQHLFPGLPERVEFLSHFLTIHLLDAGAFSREGEENFKIEAEFQIRTLRILNLMLKQSSDKGPTITDTTFTNILLALTAESAIVRGCALAMIEQAVRSADRNGLSKAHNEFLNRLLKRREELLMDGEQLSLIMFTIFSSSDSKQFKPVLAGLTQRTIDPEMPGYIVRGVMDFLKLLDDSSVFITAARKAVTILETANGDSKRLTIDPHESVFLQLFIARFNSEMTALIVRNDVCKRFVLLALESHKPLVGPSFRKHYTPSIMLIEALAEEMFESLPKPFASQVLQHIVEAATLSEHPETNAATAKLFKNATIDASLALVLIDAMISKPGEAAPKTPARKSVLRVAPSERILSTLEWKRGVTLLEHLQNKKKLDNPQLLVPKLFECLKFCLEFEEQSSVEYVKQIVLSLLHHCTVKVEQLATGGKGQPAAAAAPFGIGNAVLKVELIVQCIRGTQNPQTHHHALLLLAHVARYVPEQVLHNMMEIFTFVGSSIVRQDNAYSFQIIAKIIETIIPTIAQGGSSEQVIPILKIFSDIILDVPEHRRILLYVKLLQTLGASQFLWVFLGVLIESDVMKGGRKAELRSQQASKSRVDAELSGNELSKRMEIALQIAREFEPTVIIETCTNLIQYLRELPMEMVDRRKDDPHEAMEVDSASESVIFNVKTHTARHLKHFNYSLVQFVGGLISSVYVINKIAQLNEEQTLGMKKYYQQLIVGILTYVNAVSKTIDKVKAESVDEKIPTYWRAMLNNCYDILEGTISLLSAETLIIVVHGLLKHRFLMVRRKVIELLNNKLQYKQDYFNDTHQAGLLKLLDPLMELVKGVHDETTVVGTTFEKMVIVQLCYISLRHLSKILTQHATKKVQAILGDLVEELHGYKKNPNPQILASLILCIGELCSNLGPHSINFLPRFMPMVQKFLHAQLQSEEPFDMLTISIVLLTVKIVDTLSRFLSPYLRSMLVGLAKLYALLEKRNDARLANINSRLVLIWDNLATTIEPRVLIPAIEATYHDLIEEGELEAIGPLMRLLSTSFGKLQSADFAAIRSELSDLFLTALQFRCNHATSDRFKQEAVDAAEEHVIKAFVVLILKLSESTFRPLFYQVFEWSIRESSSNDRAITFFNLCCHVAEALKSLFVLFASDLIAIATKLLNATNSARVERKEEEALHFTEPTKNVTLLRYVLKTLYAIVLYDNQHFMNAVRFDMLLAPVTDQLENELIVKDTEVRQLVIDCIAQMAVAVMDDSLWRQLNHQVLLKTRNGEPDVRLFALEACTEIARKLGESYVPLLPETIPFVAELMEDDNEDIEKAVQHSCREIGRATGDDLQKYF